MDDDVYICMYTTFNKHPAVSELWVFSSLLPLRRNRGFFRFPQDCLMDSGESPEPLPESCQNYALDGDTI